MDSNAFLTLPSSSFSPVPAGVDEDLQGAQINGASPYNEGERRRKEMLDVAMGLEERYRVLLPPDRRYLEREKKQNTGSEPDVEPVEEEDEMPELDLKLAIEESNKQSDKLSDKLKLKIKFPSREQSSIPAKPTYPAIAKKKRATLSPTATRTSTLSRMSPSATFPISVEPSSTPSPFYSSNPSFLVSDTDDTIIHRKLSIQIAEPVSSPRPNKRRKGIHDAEDMDRAVPSHEYSNGVAPIPTITTFTSISAPHARTKQVPRSPTSTKSGYAGLSSSRDAERPTCLLMVSALRTSSVPMARKTQRHITAFGVKVPEALEDIREFELPWWILPDEEDEVSQEIAPGDIEQQDHVSSTTAGDVRTFLDESLSVTQDSEAAPAVP